MMMMMMMMMMIIIIIISVPLVSVCCWLFNVPEPWKWVSGAGVL